MKTNRSNVSRSAWLTMWIMVFTRNQRNEEKEVLFKTAIGQRFCESRKRIILTAHSAAKKTCSTVSEPILMDPVQTIPPSAEKIWSHQSLKSLPSYMTSWLGTTTLASRITVKESVSREAEKNASAIESCEPFKTTEKVKLVA